MSLKKVGKDLDKALQRGAARALTRAMRSARTKIAKDLKKDTGLSTKDVKARILGLSANVKQLRTSINIATSFDVGLRKFKPRTKMVSVRTEHGRRKYQGVSVKIGKDPRRVVPGAFMLDTIRGPIVVGRKQAFDGLSYTNPKAPRYRTKQLKTKIFRESAVARTDEVRKHMRDKFNERVNHELEFALKQQLKKNTK